VKPRRTRERGPTSARQERVPARLRPPSFLKRCVRLVRLALHFLWGLILVATTFPRLSPARQNRVLRRWSRRLLAIADVRVQPIGMPEQLPERMLLVTNHVSWLDIFVVHAVAPSIFIAKSEIRDWPLAGFLVARVGTLFLERGRSRHAQQTNGRIARELEAGRVVAVCPEGTTSDGSELKRFHAALLQPAIDAAAMVQPLALRYVDARGERTTAAAYVGDTSLLESVWRIVSEPRLVAEAHFTRPIRAAHHERRALAHEAENAIRRALGLEASGSAHGTAHGPRVGSPQSPRPTRSPRRAPAD